MIHTVNSPSSSEEGWGLCIRVLHACMNILPQERQGQNKEIPVLIVLRSNSTIKGSKNGPISANSIYWHHIVIILACESLNIGHSSNVCMSSPPLLLNYLCVLCVFDGRSGGLHTHSGSVVVEVGRGFEECCVTRLKKTRVQPGIKWRHTHTHANELTHAHKQALYDFMSLQVSLALPFLHI